MTVMKLQENFNEPQIRLYPCGLAEELFYDVPELGRRMSGAGWMRFGIQHEFPAGDYETMVFHFYAV